MESNTDSGDNDPSDAEEGTQEVLRRSQGELSRQSSVLERKMVPLATCNCTGVEKMRIE